MWTSHREADDAIMWSTAWLLLTVLAFSNGDFTNHTPSTKRPWFVLVDHPLEVCIHNMFGESYGSKGITFISTKLIMSCTSHFHRTRMKCTRTDPTLMKFYGLGPHNKPSEVMRTPCGHIALEAHVTYMNRSWLISVASLLTVNITFTHFSIPKATANCKRDGLHVEGYDVRHYSGHFCGKRKPFTVIPNVSSINVRLILGRLLAVPEEETSFIMLYQLTDKYKYTISGRADFENIETDTSLMYTISENHYIMKYEGYSVCSLHFNVQIGYFVNVKVFLRSLGEGTVVQAYDGPSTSCYLLKEFYLLHRNESASSFGTSLLLLLRTNSLFNNSVSVSFTRLMVEVEKSVIVARHSKNELLIPLRKFEYCSNKHSIIYCKFWMKSNAINTYIKLEQVEIDMDIPYV